MVIFNEKFNRNGVYEEAKTYLKTHKEHNINSYKKFYLEDLLYELIRKNTRFDIIKIFIEKQIFYNKSLFYHSITYNNYRTARLLLHYDTSLLCYSSLFSYYHKINCLDTQKILFILNIKRDKSYRVSELLCQLINWSKSNTIKKLLNYNDMNSYFIIEVLSLYKNRIALSDKEFEKILYHPNYNNNYYNINEKTKNGEYPLLTAIKRNDMRSILDYAKKFNIILELNEKDRYSYSPIFQSVVQDNLYIIKLLIEYAIENNIILNFNEKDYNGNYLLLKAMKNKNKVEIVKLFIDYSQKFNIILELNEKNSKGDCPLLLALDTKELAHLIIGYAKENHIVLKIGDHDNDNYDNKDNNLFFYAIRNYDFEFIQLLMDYNKDHHIVFNTYKNYDFTDLFFCSMKYNRFNAAKFLLEKGASTVNNKETIINYLNRNNSISFKKVLFLLNIKKGEISTVGDILCELVELNQLKILKKLLYYNDMNISFVKRMLSIYENKTSLSDNNLKKLTYHPDYNNNFININVKRNNGDYPLLCAIKRNDLDMMKLFIDYVKTSQVILILNDRNMENEDPLLCAVQNNNKKMVHLLMKYAKEHHIILKMNDHTNTKNGFLFNALKTCNIELIQLLIRYAEENNIPLDINENELFNDQNFSIFFAKWGNGARLRNLLMDYINENCISLDLKKKTKNGDYPLLTSIRNNSIQFVKFLMNFVKEKGMVLDINGKNDIGEYPLLLAVEKYDIQLVQLLMNYAKENNMILEIKDKPKMRNVNYSSSFNPLSIAIKDRNEEMVKLLLNYAKENNIILNLNEKPNFYFAESNPLYFAIKINNIKIVQLLLNYAIENNIIIEMDEVVRFDVSRSIYCNPLLWAIKNNYNKVVQLMLNYAKESNIILDINKKSKIEGIYYNQIYKRSEIKGIYYNPLLMAIKNNNTEVVKWLIQYAKESNTILEISRNSRPELIKTNALLWAIKNNNMDIVRLLLKYTKENNIPLSITETCCGERPMMMVVRENNVDLIRLIFQYAKETNLIEDINKNYPLLWAIMGNNISMVQLILDCAEECHLIYDLNENFPLIWAILNNNTEMVKFLLSYAREKNITLTFNSYVRNDTEILELLLDYANKSIPERHSTLSVLDLLMNFTKRHNNLLLRFLKCYDDYFTYYWEYVK